jgi:hypothetical protein
MEKTVPDEIEIIIDGEPHRASYTVERGIVTVATALGRKSAPVGRTQPDRMARLLLSEMVREGTA